MKRAKKLEQLRKVGADYFAWHGNEVLERDWVRNDTHMDVIAFDPKDNVLIFADLYVATADSHDFPQEDLSPETRARFERAMIAYVSENDVAPCRVRYDTLLLYSVSDETACVRYCPNALRLAA